MVGNVTLPDDVVGLEIEVSFNTPFPAVGGNGIVIDPPLRVPGGTVTTTLKVAVSPIEIDGSDVRGLDVLARLIEREGLARAIEVLEVALPVRVSPATAVIGDVDV